MNPQLLALALLSCVSIFGMQKDGYPNSSYEKALPHKNPSWVSISFYATHGAIPIEAMLFRHLPDKEDPIKSEIAIFDSIQELTDPTIFKRLLSHYTSELKAVANSSCNNNCTSLQLPFFALLKVIKMHSDNLLKSNGVDRNNRKEGYLYTLMFAGPHKQQPTQYELDKMEKIAQIHYLNLKSIPLRSTKRNQLVNLYNNAVRNLKSEY